MGFRFRKSVKIAPGVRLNLNRKSATINHQDEHTTFITMIGNVFVLFCPFPGLK